MYRYFSKLVRDARLSEAEVEGLLDSWHHNGAESHRVEHADDAGHEHDRVEQQRVGQHPKDIVVGEVNQDDVQPQWCAAHGDILVLANSLLQLDVGVLVELISDLVDVSLRQQPGIEHAVGSEVDGAAALRDLAFLPNRLQEVSAWRFRLRLHDLVREVVWDLDVLEAVENRFDFLLAPGPEVSYHGLLHGDPVALRAALVVLKHAVESPEEVDVDVLEQLFDVGRGVLPDLGLELAHEVLFLHHVYLEPVVQDLLAVQQHLHDLLHVRLSNFHPEVRLQFVDRWVYDFLDGLERCLGRDSVHFVHFSLSLALDYRKQLSLELVGILSNLVFPLRAFHYDGETGLFELVEGGIEQLGCLGSELVVNGISFVDAAKLHVKPVEHPLPQNFKLRGEAHVKSLIELGLQLQHHLVEDDALVLVGVFLEVFGGLHDDGCAPPLEVSQHFFFRIDLQSVDLRLNFLDCLGLDLGASEVGNHLPLVWQVELLLVADDVPSLVDKHLQPIEREVFVLALGEDVVFGGCVEPGLELGGLDVELVLLEDLVREHAELDVEEILGLFILVLIRFVDLAPDGVDVHRDLVHEVLEVVADVVEVTQHEQEFLGRLLAEELQVAFKYYLEQAVVRGAVSANVLGPHVDK